MNVAVVDIGSNSTRLLIAELDGDRVSRELVRHSEVTRLGAGGDAVLGPAELAGGLLIASRAVLAGFLSVTL